ncbi:C2 calcium-dependent domain-containing protein 4C [Bagarius yarrelli]|uniref:C2 calcium-dependent domain-containing protein 4C n=1 Tax=Bagarius yarrelli TaxID=175774 RepID=A0A556U285_BAGYA|nr:C2 calcium-dependent domain-containing protein 4C [Bagarius yarrelli]
MWILRKVQESAENLPADISRLMNKSSDEISAKAKLLNKLHNNVLTPDKIPDFFLPPKLSKRSLVAAESIISRCLDTTGDNWSSRTSQPISETMSQMLKTDKNKGTGVATRRQIKPIPFSVKNYESGYFESPNTRRKESLFHSALSSYTLERMSNKLVPKLPSITLLKVDSLESDTSSSADSSPHNSPLPIRNKHEIHSSKESLVKNDLLGSKTTYNKIKLVKDCCIAQTTSSSLAPPLQFPLDMLHCQERLHSEHVLLLPRRGCIRLSASRADMNGDQSTVRIRVISVEDLRDPGDPRPLHCGLTLSLSPGKLQRQHSAIIKNCRNPMFNEDFFFMEPEGENQVLRNFSIRVKVLEKNPGLGRIAVLGVIIKPLTELLEL